MFILRAFSTGLFFLIVICTWAQTVPFHQQYPNVLRTTADSFYVNSGNWAKPYAFFIGESEGDTIDLGTDGYAGAFIDVVTGKDTTRFKYVNLPYQQWHYVPIQSPTKKVIYRLRFNPVSASYSHEYVVKNTNQVRYEIPEVYELANIIWALSPSGKRASNLYTQGDYYQRVTRYFAPYLTHPIFGKLDFPEKEYYTNYYDFRENSLCFSFDANTLRYTGPYYYVMGTDWDNFNSLFKQLVPLLEDFAQKSNYRKFFRENQPYYNTLLRQESELMPVRQMWQWLENRFPQRYQAYKVVFSPLIGATHSTQQFAYKASEPDWFREVVMFVSGPESFMNRHKLSPVQKEGLASGIVFTEIDHNYVNSTTSRYQKQVNPIFENRAIWTKAGGDTDHYNSPEAVFNEYMTHALFCLYVRDQYDKPTADYVIDQREKLMVDRRQYIKFKAFNQQLQVLYQQRKPGQLVSDLYPALLDWARSIN